MFFANSGAEANEGAIKLARKWGKKFKDGAYEIITFDHSFHGRTLATMSASGKAGWDTIYAPQVPGFPKAELNDIASVEKLITRKTVGVMLEPIQGEGGVIPATREFMQQLRALTKKHNLLLIVDEVQSGCGRAGTLFAYELSGVEPDIMTLGKGIGGGVPLAALLSKAEIACFEAGRSGRHLQRQSADDGGRLFGDLATDGAGLSRRRARARRVSEVATAAACRKSAASRASAAKVCCARCCSIADNGPQIVEKARLMQPDGLLLNAARPNLLRFMPALNVTKDEIDQMMAMLRSSAGFAVMTIRVRSTRATPMR